MTKNVNKKVAALAMVAVMGVGGLGMAKLANMTTTASADTGTHSSYALHASTGTIGINQHATVDVSSAAPATLTLNNVAAGQYMLVAKVIEATGDYYWIDLSATVNESTTYLSENDYLGAFVGTVTVASNSTIELNTYSGATLTVEVWLQPLAIGQFNDYYLSDIEISSTTSRTIALDGVSGTYRVVVETYNDMTPSAVIMVNGTALTKNPNMFGAWTGDFTLTGMTSLVLSTTNPEVTSVNLSLREDVNVTTPLPTTEAAAATFGIYETKDFYYINYGQSGYYTIDVNSNVENAQFSYVVKTNPNDYTGINVQGDNYPIYMKQYTMYYVSVTYTGIPWELGEESPETVDAWFTVSGWNTTDLELRANEEALFVPITASGEATVEIPMSVAAGTYDLNLISIPDYIMNDSAYTITAHFGTQEIELEYGYAQVEITNETSIWFTTNYSTGFTVGVTLNSPEIIETIELGEWTEISIPAGESCVYYVENLADGYFNITLRGLNGANIVVESGTSSYPIISEGQFFGTFRAYAYDEGTTTVALYFYNYSGFDATFEAYVQATNNVVMQVGVVTSIQLASGETKVYYLENLAEGIYNIALANAAGIEVTANGMPVTDGRFVTNYDGESVALRFTNTGDKEVVFTVTVTMIANGVITVGGEETYIFMDPSSNVKTYVVEGLVAGNEYKITLSDYVTDITVMMGNTTVIEAGATTGTFVATGASVTLTITYNGADFLYFSVLVTG